MPSIPAGFIEATFIFRCSGIDRDMTWSHGFDSLDFPTTDAGALATLIYNEYVGTGNPITAANMIDSYTFKGVHVVKQMEEGPMSGGHFADVTGTATTDALPPNCTALFTKTTASGGRRNRGRFFLPIYTPGEASVDAAGVIEPTLVTTLNTLYASFKTGLFAAGFTAMLFHQTAPFTPTPVTQWSCQSRIATQRRRLRS